MTEHFSESDRRKWARVDIQASVAFYTEDSRTIQARICNISEGGALIVTFKRLPVDIAIEMSFMMADKKEEDGRALQRLIAVRGKIRHTRVLETTLFESGVEFDRLEEKDRQVIRRCVSASPKK